MKVKKKPEMNDNLRRRHFLLYLGCSSESSSPMSNNTDGDEQVPEVWRDKGLSLFMLQNILVASKHPRNSLSSYCSSLLVQISVLKHLDASFNHSKPPQSTSELSWSSPKPQAEAEAEVPQLQGRFVFEFQKISSSVRS